MSSEKIKLIAYMTPQEKEIIKRRAKKHGMTIGAYCSELAMWENRFELLPQLRKGGSITCNGRAKKT